MVWKKLVQFGKGVFERKEESTSTDMPLGTAMHNIEITFGRGGSANLRLPSGEIRLVSQNCLATVGQVGNVGKQTTTPCGYPAVGRRTRKRKKYSDIFILHRRK
ncbi:hypothetical protein ZWY2020_056766 [Hordeum vulgare]|nr:hypothetical protein ZWY2020_056766 [Hordeum vulgare]